MTSSIPKLPNGLYHTKTGSTVEISGKHGGISTVNFDWLEEPHACDSCHVDPYPEWDVDRWILTWGCDVCDGGFAEIYPVKEAA